MSIRIANAPQVFPRVRLPCYHVQPSHLFAVYCFSRGNSDLRLARVLNGDVENRHLRSCDGEPIHVTVHYTADCMFMYIVDDVGSLLGSYFAPAMSLVTDDLRNGFFPNWT